jgi:hypothetical protein
MIFLIISAEHISAAVATLVTADDLGTTTRWPSSVQFDALHWWRNVTFDKCSPGGDCEGEGQLCNDYPPCTRGWCDECDDDYVAYITPSLHFTCIKCKTITFALVPVRLLELTI